jgi:hypothetical protein
MGRIRTIKPEFWRNEGLSELPEATHLLAAALLNYCDDEGYFNANEKLVQSECCPLREPSTSISDSLTRLSNNGYLRLGTGKDGRRYGHIVKFLDHQRINRPTPSKIKNLDIHWEGSPIPHTQLSEPSSPERKGREREGEGNGNGVGGSATSSKEHVFTGRFVKDVTEEKLQTWLKQYPLFNRSSLLADIELCDAYYRDADKKPDNWYFALLAWLKRTHERQQQTKATTKKSHNYENDIDYYTQRERMPKNAAWPISST